MQTTVDIDTGGTFTDGVVRRGSTIQTLKTTTTPHDLTVCFSQIIEKGADTFDEDLRDFLASVDCIRYSTTLGTNAVIEREGADIGVLSSDGLMDGLDRSEQLVTDILEQGTTRTLSDDAEGEEIAQRYNELAEELVDSITVGQASLEAERSTRDAVTENQPRHLLGSVPVHLSFEVTDDPNDQRRFKTTLVDSYLHPKLGDFLYKAEDFLRDNGYNSPLLVFCNDGTSSRVAKTMAIRTYNSGPSAGIKGVSEVSELYDVPNAIALDIGGTSADVAIIEDGEIARDEFGEIDGVDTSFPMRKLYPTDGAGGTIAKANNGELKLGPESAGARPGPACYGLGGQEATVTDADVVSGIIDPDLFAGDDISLDANRAERAIKENLAKPLGKTPVEAAFSVRDELERKIGQYVTETLETTGSNPDESMLVAYGGAGPTHACGIAEYAGIERVISPGFPSVFSAYSVGFSNVVHDYHIRVNSKEAVSNVNSEIEKLRSRATRDMQGEGFEADEVEFTWQIRGIKGDTAVSLGTFDSESVQQEMEGKISEYDQLDLVLTAQASLPTHEFASIESEAELDAVAERSILWKENGESREIQTPVYDVRDLRELVAETGPAILRAETTTYAIPPGWSFENNEYGHTVMTMEEN